MIRGTRAHTYEQFLKMSVSFRFRLVFVCLFKFSILCVFCFYLTLFSFCVVCFYCVRFSFFSTMPRGWLGRTSPKWPMLCRVGHKTLTQSVSQFTTGLVTTVDPVSKASDVDWSFHFGVNSIAFQCKDHVFSWPVWTSLWHAVHKICFSMLNSSVLSLIQMH